MKWVRWNISAGLASLNLFTHLWYRACNRPNNTTSNTNTKRSCNTMINNKYSPPHSSMQDSRNAPNSGPKQAMQFNYRMWLYDKKSENGNKSVQMRHENCGASKVVENRLPIRVSDTSDAQLQTAILADTILYRVTSGGAGTQIWKIFGTQWRCWRWLKWSADNFYHLNYQY